MKPILFSTLMVQAILNGKKSQTRRVIKFPDGLTGSHLVGTPGDPDNPIGLMWAGGIKRPKYQPSDILWVRETWCNINWPGIEPEYFFFADALDAEDYDRSEWSWKPSIHMPKAAARIFLRVTGVRAERLQDITEDDAYKEGCRYGDRYGGPNSTPALSARQSFMWLWQRINAKRGYDWPLNPWVWVYTFERCEKPQSE